MNRYIPQHLRDDECDVCGTPGCREGRGADFHAGLYYGALHCDYTGKPPFKDDEMCPWCAGTGHPYGDESYGMCEHPGIDPNRSLDPNHRESEA